MSLSSSIRPPSSTLGAPQKTVRGPYANDALKVPPPTYPYAAGGRLPDTTRLSPSASFPLQSSSVAAAPPLESHSRGNFAKPTIEPYSDSVNHQLSRNNSHSIPLDSPSLDSDKGSVYDDGTRPFHVFREQQSNPPNAGNLPPQGYSAIPPHLNVPDNSVKERPSSRPPSRNDSVYSNPSAAGLMQNNRHSRSSSIQTNADDTVVMGSPTSVTPDVGSSSKTFTSVKLLLGQGGPQDQQPSATLSPTDVNGYNVPKRFSSTSDISLEESRSANTSRSASPAYRADVPHSVESGTDTEPENEPERPQTKRLPPAPPPKESKGTRPTAHDTETDLDTSKMSQFADVSGDLLESLHVEHMSHSTFIAPALPPIRFSLNTTDFSELLGSVGGMMSLRPLDDVAMLTRQKQDDNALTTSLVATPTLATNEEHAVLSPSETSDGQTPKLEDASPAILSSSLHDNEFSGPSDPRLYSDRAQITITEPESTMAVILGQNNSDLIYKRLQETSNIAKKTRAQHLQVDISLIDAVIEFIESQKAEYHDLKGKVEGMNVGHFPIFFRPSVLKLCR